MKAANNDIACIECFGIGSRELLVVLEKPELSGEGKVIRYVRKTIPCGSCLEKKISRPERFKNPAFRETLNKPESLVLSDCYDKLFLR